MFFCSFALAVDAPQLRVAITIDDLPWAEISRTETADLEPRHHRLLAALKGTHAIGFVNEDKLRVDDVIAPERRRMLDDWLDAGLDLGNHGYGHLDLHLTPVEEYEQAISLGERESRKLLAARGRKPQWFRHPFLHAGRDAKTRAHLADFLDKHGYRVAPVTIDNSEWIFASAYLKLLERQDDERAARLRAEYVDYMGAKFAYFEDQSQALLGRQPAQILLLHANVLNADALPELLEKIGERGYEFISLDEAMKDSAYALEDGYFGPAGITWLHRWALSQKKPASFYAGEPKVSQEVLDIAGIESE